MKEWDVHKKPPENICPEEFCFFWSSQSRCRETFGVCKRNNADISDKDWYEPCEPKLKSHQLPWFYFISNADNIDGELKEDYIRESNYLWGTD